MAAASPDSVERFSNRVDTYARYRPSYPPAVLDCLMQEAGLNAASTVADIGAGTGILTALLLQSGCTVVAVEPNDAMRAAAEAALLPNPRLTFVNARSEATGLPAQSVDLVTAAQAFHWFEPVGTRAEFQRILRPGGYVALIWNNRQDEGTPFSVAYHKLLDTYGTDFKRVDHKYASDDAAIARFFAPSHYRLFQFPNHQDLDWDGFLGRLLSSSYIPVAGDPEHEGMVATARQIYDTYSVNGTVRIEYVTQVYLGQL